MKLEDALNHYGGQSSLARALVISQATVAEWKEIPPLRQLQIERDTKGKLKADPDVFGIPTRRARAIKDAAV